MNKQDIFKNYSLKTGTVEVANWGGEVQIRELSAAAMAEMQALEGKELNMAATAIIHGVINEDGKRLFNANDIEKLLEMTTKDLVIVSAAIIKLSDLGADSGK